MVYSVVEFLNEKSIAVVPSCWFNIITNKCAWPKKSVHSATSVRRFLDKLEPYNKKDFDLFDARIFKNNFGTYYINFLYIKLININFKKDKNNCCVVYYIQ